MMQKLVLSIAILCLSAGLYAQTGFVKGVVKDKNSGETLIGANIVFKNNPGQGTVTDFDGNFELGAPYGSTTFVVSYIGYDPYEFTAVVSNIPTSVTIKLTSIMLDEVLIIADFARARETPIAFSNVLPSKLEEELAGRDIPMVLNSTPGVYATEQGGGDGDARISIRGFNQKSVAVMLDGVPVNDMETGSVYWSNWFGLDMITRTIQVQRGLGASKLGIPAVGGTMNIMTQGISNKPSGAVKQEITDYGYYRTSFGVSSGRIGNWGVTAAGSYKWGSGWADATDTRGFFYYLKMERRLGKHVVSLTGFGAPQEHQQRSYKTSVTLIDSAYAVDVAGIELTPETTPKFMNLGRKYNQHWGYLNRWSLDEQGDTVWGNREKQSEKINYYHKPQFSLKDTWKVNDKFFVSNTLYMSIGNGGGTGLLASPRLGTRETPNIDFQSMYDTNYDNFRESSGYRESRKILNSSVNNHFWYGLLSSAEYQLDESLTLSGGIDLRSYTGEHYQEIYDLLGGEIHLDEQGNTPNYSNPDRNRYKRVGDKIRFHNDGLVKWYGVFGQLEYITPNWSGFVSSSVSDVSYQRIDYFAPYYYEDTEIKMRRRTNLDPTLYFSDTLNIDGEQYYIGHPEVTQKNKYSAKQNIWGYTVKAGFNYNLTERVNAFINLGNLSRAPRFNNAFGRNVNTIPKNLKNEQVYAVELGTGFNSSKFSYNINGYFTYWLNKPLDYALSKSVDDETYFLHLTGLAARHMGIEFDAVYKPIKELEIQGLFSLGDWIYKSADSVSYVDVAGNPAPVTAINYDAKGVHVGDAAQTQIGGSVRYYPIKDLFMQARATYFARNFANFNPESLQKTTEYDYRRKESWLMPSYGLVDVSIGYSFQIYEKYKAGINFNVLNLFDTMYITDATNNDSNLEIGGQNTFDGRAAGIYMGMGRRFNLSFRLFF